MDAGTTISTITTAITAMASSVADAALGIYSGITSAKSDFQEMTYGGNVWVNRFLGMSKRSAISFVTSTSKYCRNV